MATLKTKTKSGQSQDSNAGKLAAENARLRAEVERLKTDRDKRIVDDGNLSSRYGKP